MKWIYADRIEVALDANGNPTEVITEEDRVKQRMLREENKEAPVLVYKEHEEVYEQSLEGICEEYGFDIKGQRQRDETPVEVQFWGVKKTMPKWKALEFRHKLNKLGWNPEIDGDY